MERSGLRLRRLDISEQPGLEQLPVRQLPVTWGTTVDLPVLASNQLAVQVDLDSAGQPDTLILTFGHTRPPIMTGTPEQIKEQAEQLGQVIVVPVVRLGVSIQRMKEFSSVLQQTIALIAASQAVVTEPPSAEVNDG